MGVGKLLGSEELGDRAAPIPGAKPPVLSSVQRPQ